jgi:hypothetical protein
VRRRLAWGVIVVGALVLLGGLLWPLEAKPNRLSDLGVGLIGGLITAVGLVLDRQFAKQAEKRDLILTLGTGDRFVGIDLRGRDLSGVNLAGKDFSGARFDKAKLRGVNFSGANLSWVSFAGADIRGAKFDRTPLYPSEYLRPSPNLSPGAIAPG